ncbi:hypothetical protein QQP08_012744 [Theobroma cacao]|nr:hypothetical protein QQP08_012744 [Theobroma cacao]
MASPLLSLASSQLSSDIPTVSASPVSMSDPPLAPFQELSPDIAPLFPSPGGVVPTTGSSMPTIPSSPSPPNPDDVMAAGPDSAAFPPFGSLPGFSARLYPLLIFFISPFSPGTVHDDNKSHAAVRDHLLCFTISSFPSVQGNGKREKRIKKKGGDEK